MKKGKLLIIALILIMIIASLIFYNTVFQREAPDFNEGIVMPKSVAIFEKEITDKIVVKTIVMEIKKSPLEKATKKDMESIDDKDKALSIRAIYNEGDSKAGRLKDIEILSDGTFIASKTTNGRDQYVKGKFGGYTLNYLTGIYTLQ